MQIILHQDYACAPDGHTTLRFVAGDVLTGRAAELALTDGAGFDPALENKIEPKLQTKRGRK